MEKEEAAAKAAGIRYFHVPYDGSADLKAADAFLTAITTKGAEPAFIHCAGGNRAATMWLIKRIAIDKWDIDRATKEAILLGQTNPTMRQFAIDFGQAHRVRCPSVHKEVRVGAGGSSTPRGFRPPRGLHTRLLT